MKDDRRCCSPQEGKSAGVFWGGTSESLTTEVSGGSPWATKSIHTDRPSLEGQGRAQHKAIPPWAKVQPRGLGTGVWGGARGLPTLKCFKMQVPWDTWEVAVAQTQRV